jgi:DNA (cytosine-5)-methyltransferase 1
MMSELLPTPNTMDMLPRRSDEALARAKAGGGTSNLKDHDLVRNPDEQIEWGQYGPAVARWENVLGRSAPKPTEPTGRDGQQQLSARFTEWMMGLDDGWITGCGLTRNEALKACGNGVVPQQASLALRLLLQGKDLFNDR